jgi:hypothetical protein
MDIAMMRVRVGLLAVAYAALLAHLLFIPYAFSPLPFDEALRRFVDTPWLRLGSDQNVALVSRALMFLPLGILLAAWVAPRPERPIELPALLVAGLLGCLWAVVVNFAAGYAITWNWDSKSGTWLRSATAVNAPARPPNASPSASRNSDWGAAHKPCARSGRMPHTVQ